MRSKPISDEPRSSKNAMQLTRTQRLQLYKEDLTQRYSASRTITEKLDIAANLEEVNFQLYPTVAVREPTQDPLSYGRKPP